MAGPSTALVYDVDFHLTNGATTVAQDSVHVDAYAEFGVLADTMDVAKKQAALLVRKLAIAIAEKLRANRVTILETCTGFSA